MAYDQALAARVRQQMSGLPDMVEKKMFGGLSFLLHGNMATGVIGNDLLVRIHPDQAAQLLAAPHVKPFDIYGRESRGWVMVEPAGVASDDDLKTWIDRGSTYARSLPPK
jgi:hypothetical protein